MKNLLLILFALFTAYHQPCYSQLLKNKCVSNSSLRQEIIYNKQPFQYICHIYVNRRFSSSPSTAALVSPNLLLTAGHSAGEWRKLFPNKIKSIRVVLFQHYGNDGQVQQLADLTFNREVLKFGAHPKFKGNKTPEYDYGYIKLPSDTLYKITKGHFIIGHYDTLKTKADSIYITGYPSDKQEIKDGSLWNKGDTIGNIKETPGYLFYSIYTETGDSGAPIWTYHNGNYYIIGIHNRGPENANFMDCRGGQKINTETIKIIEGWQNQ